MSLGDLLKVKIREVPCNSLEERLIVERYVRRVWENLSESEAAYEAFSSMARDERGMLHELENVLLRFDAPDGPKKWRDFVRATIKRKGDRTGESFRNLIRDTPYSLPHNDGALHVDHQVERAMRAARRPIWRELREREDDEVLRRWAELLDDTDKAIRVTAVREWLCFSLRRAFFHAAN